MRVEGAGVCGFKGVQDAHPPERFKNRSTSHRFGLAGLSLEPESKLLKGGSIGDYTRGLL